MKRIGFLLGGFQNNGGIGRVTSIIANALCEHDDMEVTTIAYCQNNGPLLYPLSNRIHTYSLFSAPVPMTKAILFQRTVQRIREILKKEKLDVLIAAGALFFPVAILATRGTSAKCFCWEHTDPGTVSDHRFQGWCRKYAVKHAERIIVLTRSAQKYYLDKLHACSEKLLQIYNPITNSSSPTTYDINSKKIIAVGRLTYQKNFDRLIRLADIFLQDYPEWSVDIYGKGSDHHSLQQQIDSLNLTNRVHLMGQVNNLYERYSQYAFQVMTSRYEGFPMSLLEGATYRLPLVSFDIPTGPDEIIYDGKNGFLIDKEDDNRMIECICQLMDDPALRFSMSNASHEMVQTFSLNEIIDQWCNIL